MFCLIGYAVTYVENQFTDSSDWLISMIMHSIWILQLYLIVKDCRDLFEYSHQIELLANTDKHFKFSYHLHSLYPIAILCMKSYFQKGIFIKFSFFNYGAVFNSFLS